VIKQQKLILGIGVAVTTMFAAVPYAQSASAVHYVGRSDGTFTQSEQIQAAAPPEVQASTRGPWVGGVVAFAETEPLRVLAARAAERAVKQGKPEEGEELYERWNPDTVTPIVPGAGAGGATTPFVDPMLKFNSPFAPLAMPGPSLTFEGMNAADRVTVFGNLVMPPDTQGDVGPNHYVSMVNGPVGIYNKATGTLAMPPFKLSSLFTGLTGGAATACATNDNGDPVVLYDTIADRWIITQFGIAVSTATPPWFECIAVSKTADPTGAYYTYAFQTPDAGGFPDYPHLGVWPDAYYMTTHQNGFLPPPGAAGRGTGFFAFDRAKLLIGDPTATYVYFDRPTAGEGGILPTHLNGILPPAVGTPQILIRYIADEFGAGFIDGVRPYQFVPNFATPASSTLTVLTDVAVAPFDARQPANRADIEQPAPALAANNLDSLNDRTMYHISYRNLGTMAAPVNSYTMTWGVNVSGAAAGTLVPTTFTSGIRWTELRRDQGTGAITVRDQGTHANALTAGANGINYWMPHINQDNQGNIAVGFSASGIGDGGANPAVFPSIRWAGRTGSSPTGTLNEGEATMFAGDGTQDINNSRWGDYSSMSVDPTDDCTFYYHQEYRIAANSGTTNNNPFRWSTRVGRFQFPTCTATPRGTATVTVTSCGPGTPVAEALVTATGGFATSTNASGVAVITMPPGSYDFSASRPLASSGAPVPATITNGANTNVNLCLTGQPQINSTTGSLVSESFAPPNGAIDPGETVTVSLCVTNTGLANTVALTGTLAATGGVTSPGAPTNLGVVVAGGPAVCGNFTFVADPAMTCGAPVTPTVAYADGASSFGNKVYAPFITGVVSGTSTQTFSYTGPPVSVPDNTAAGVNISLPVSGAGAQVTDLNFRFDTGSGTCNATLGNVEAAMDHTFIGDLVFKLTAPDGTTSVVPMSGRGGTRENICATLLDDDGGFPSLSTVSNTTGQFLSGNFAPDNPLSGFDGKVPNGAWTLNVADIANVDTGSMRRFSLVITSESRTCAGAVSDAIFSNGFE
jgi:subtilisin-like proprotein convertase family protein